MALNVITNVFSLNAQRNLARSSSALGKSLERLSSGLRINRAADDAAGLAISEGLRSQIRGLNQAVRNANDGVSLVSTAEGATSEVTAILQRVRELAVQAASDTNSQANRSALDKEASALLAELDRISSTVEFNGTKLLDGTFSGKSIQVGAFANQTVDITLASIRTSTLGAVTAADVTGTAIDANVLADAELKINGVFVGASDDSIQTGESIAQGSSARQKAAAINFANTGATATANTTTLTAANATAALDFSGAQSGDITINGVTIDLNGDNFTADNSGRQKLLDKINAQTTATGVVATEAAGVLTFTATDGRNITIVTTGGDGSDNGTGEALGLIADGGGTEEDQFDNTATPAQSTIDLTSGVAIAVLNSGGSLAAAGLANGTTATTTSGNLLGVNVLTREAANSAITAIDAALIQIADNRSSLGALTNRLESTVRSLQSISENLSASEARIREADFAAETASLAKNQILQQAGIAILAQANAVPQLALTLLR